MNLEFAEPMRFAAAGDKGQFGVLAREEELGHFDAGAGGPARPSAEPV